MNNDNLNSINYFGHNIIENMNKLSHDLLNTTIENSVPIINTFTSNNLQRNNITIINYDIKYTSNNIFIYCELPGVPKDKCRVNYKNGRIIISGESSFNIDPLSTQENSENNFYDNNNWKFIKKKNYYKDINIGVINKNDIKVKYSNGCLYIVISKKKLDKDSDIKID